MAVASTVGVGYFSLRLSMASTMILEMAMLRYHLLSLGMTNQGACLWLVVERISL